MKILSKEQIIVLHKHLIENNIVLNIASGDATYENLVQWITGHQI